MTEFDVPVSASSLQTEAEIVHSIQILSRQGVVSQLPEVLGPQILPSIARHRVITWRQQRESKLTLQVLGAPGCQVMIDMNIDIK